MSSNKPRLSRKHRYIIAGIILAIIVSVAFYNAQINFPFKKSMRWDFDSYQNGTLLGMSSYAPSKNDTSWIVMSVPDAPSKPNVLAYVPHGDSGSSYHLMLMPNSPSVDNANVTLKFKIVSGDTARSAGMILRYMDTKHYFVLMADSDVNRLSLCKETPDFLICNYEKNYTITSGQWHTLKTIISSQGIAAYVDGNAVIHSNDHNYVTGEIGLWAKKDTKVYFDDMNMAYG